MVSIGSHRSHAAPFLLEHCRSRSLLTKPKPMIAFRFALINSKEKPRRSRRFQCWRACFRLLLFTNGESYAWCRRKVALNHKYWTWLPARELVEAVSVAFCHQKNWRRRKPIQPRCWKKHAGKLPAVLPRASFLRWNYTPMAFVNDAMEKDWARSLETFNLGHTRRLNG